MYPFWWLGRVDVGGKRTKVFSRKKGKLTRRLLSSVRVWSVDRISIYHPKWDTRDFFLSKGMLEQLA